MKLLPKIIGIILLLTTLDLLGTKVEARSIRPLDRPDFFRRGDRIFEREIQRLQNRPPASILTISDLDFGWQELIFKEAGFSISMPRGFIDTRSNFIVLPRSSDEIQFRVFVNDLPSEQYLVAYSQSLKVEKSDPFLQDVRDSIVAKIGDELIRENSIEFNNYSGKELVFLDRNMLSTLRIYLIGDRLYFFSTKQEDTVENRAEVERFFNSLKLL